MATILIVSIEERELRELLGKAVGTHCKLQKLCYNVLDNVSFDGKH